ncbi:MAG: hypothetical protein Q9167_003597 [Letrouitia subvulpina]
MAVWNIAISPAGKFPTDNSVKGDETRQDMAWVFAAADLPRHMSQSVIESVQPPPSYKIELTVEYTLHDLLATPAAFTVAGWFIRVVSLPCWGVSPQKRIQCVVRAGVTLTALGITSKTDV